MELLPVDKSKEHYENCRVWLEDKEITKWLTSILRFGKYYKAVHEMLVGNPKTKLFFIKSDNRLLGLSGLFNIDKVDKRAEIFYLIGSQAERGKGVASKAVDLLKGFCVQDLGLCTIYAHVAEPNKASVKVLEKNDFKYVGKYRKAFNLDGTYTDLLIFDWVCKKLDSAQ